MFGMFKKPVAGKKLKLKLGGMHCASCSMNVDFALEELKGVREAKTQYATQRSTVTFNPLEVSPQLIIKTIKDLGYSAVIEKENNGK